MKRFWCIVLLHADVHQSLPTSNGTQNETSCTHWTSNVTQHTLQDIHHSPFYLAGSTLFQFAVWELTKKLHTHTQCLAVTSGVWFRNGANKIVHVHTKKAYGGMEEKLHALLILTLKLNGQLHAPGALP